MSYKIIYKYSSFQTQNANVAPSIHSSLWHFTVEHQADLFICIMIHMIHYVIWIMFSQVHTHIRGSFLTEICWSILHYEHLILFCVLNIITQTKCHVFEEGKGTVCPKHKKFGTQWENFWGIVGQLVRNDPKWQMASQKLRLFQVFWLKLIMVPQVGRQ